MTEFCGSLLANEDLARGVAGPGLTPMCHAQARVVHTMAVAKGSPYRCSKKAAAHIGPDPFIKALREVHSALADAEGLISEIEPGSHFLRAPTQG